MLDDSVRSLSAANISLLKENVDNEAEDLGASFGYIVALKIRVDDELIPALGQCHRSNRVGVATEVGASNLLRRTMFLYLKNGTI